MELDQDGTQLTGRTLFSFEDRAGFWGAEIGSFAATGRLVNDAFDIIFADDELVLRAKGHVVGSLMKGTLNYRTRQPNENQCKMVVVYCDVETDNSDQIFWWYPAVNFPDVCHRTPNVDAPCQAYMNTGLSQVKEMGTFEGLFSTWVQ